MKKSRKAMKPYALMIALGRAKVAKLNGKLVVLVKLRG